MSGKRNEQSENALAIAQRNAQSYYATAVPGLKTRMDSINQSLAQGEAPYLQSAYAGQRTGLTEGLAARGGAAQTQQFGLGKAALSGGNAFSFLHPADIGAQLANALYGSKFQEGQANLNQQMNLLSMGLGGSGTAGNAALAASGNQLGAIEMMSNAPPYATAAGIAALGGAGYGAYQNWLSGQPGLQPGQTLPMGQNYGSGFPSGLYPPTNWGYSPPATGSGPPSSFGGGI